MTVQLKFTSIPEKPFYPDYHVYDELDNFLGEYDRLAPILGELPEDCPTPLDTFILSFKDGKLSVPALSNEDVLKLHGKEVYDRQGRLFFIIAPSIGTSGMVVLMGNCGVLYTNYQYNLFWDIYGNVPFFNWTDKT